MQYDKNICYKVHSYRVHVYHVDILTRCRRVRLYLASEALFQVSNFWCQNLHRPIFFRLYTYRPRAIILFYVKPCSYTRFYLNNLLIKETILIATESRIQVVNSFKNLANKGTLIFYREIIENYTMQNSYCGVFVELRV